MATMNVSLPDPMKAWVEAQVHGGQYGNPSDYVRDLIRRDHKTVNRLRHYRPRLPKGLKVVSVTEPCKTF